MYDELIKRLREDAPTALANCDFDFVEGWIKEAADAIEELLKAAKAMHTWIFLNSVDEQAAYDKCGLSDEMNALLGYAGCFEIHAEQAEAKEET